MGFMVDICQTATKHTLLHTILAPNTIELHGAVRATDNGMYFLVEGTDGWFINFARVTGNVNTDSLIVVKNDRIDQTTGFSKMFNVSQSLLDCPF